MSSSTSSRLEGCIGWSGRDGWNQVVVVSVSGIHLVNKGTSNAIGAAAVIVVGLANLGLVLVWSQDGTQFFSSMSITASLTISMYHAMSLSSNAYTLYRLILPAMALLFPISATFCLVKDNVFISDLRWHVLDDGKMKKRERGREEKKIKGWNQHVYIQE